MNAVCDIKALIHQVRQNKTELTKAGSQYEQLRVCFNIQQLAE